MDVVFLLGVIMNKIYDLKFGDIIWISEIQAEFIRVPGGWICRSYDMETQKTCTAQSFIPFNNEFMDNN